VRKHVPDDRGAGTGVMSGRRGAGFACSAELLRSSPRFGVAQENVLSPFRVRDHSLTVAARCRRTAFPSRARVQAV